MPTQTPTPRRAVPAGSRAMGTWLFTVTKKMTLRVVRDKQESRRSDVQVRGQRSEVRGQKSEAQRHQQRILFGMFGKDFWRAERTHNGISPVYRIARGCEVSTKQASATPTTGMTSH